MKISLYSATDDTGYEILKRLITENYQHFKDCNLISCALDICKVNNNAEIYANGGRYILAAMRTKRRKSWNRYAFLM